MPAGPQTPSPSTTMSRRSRAGGSSDMLAILSQVSSSDGGSLLGGGSTFTAEEIMSTFTGHDDSTALIENLRGTETVTSGTRTSSGVSSYGIPISSRDNSSSSHSRRKATDPDEDVRLSRQLQAQRTHDKELPDFSSSTIVLSKDTKSIDHDAKSLPPIPTKSPTTEKPKSSPTFKKPKSPTRSRSHGGSPSRILLGQQRLESVLEAGPASDETQATDSPATALSLTSSGSNEGKMNAHENSNNTDEVANQARSREETDEIVREVQRRLIGLQGRGATNKQDANKKANSNSSELWEPPEDDKSHISKGNKYLPVIDEAERGKDRGIGEGLAAKHDMSDDEESQEGKKPKIARSKKKRCILFVILFILILLLVILIFAFLRGFGGSTKKSSIALDDSSLASSPSPTPGIRTRLPTIGATNSPSSIQGTSSPSSLLATESPSSIRTTPNPTSGQTTSSPTLLIGRAGTSSPSFRVTEGPTAIRVTPAPTIATNTPSIHVTPVPTTATETPSSVYLTPAPTTTTNTPSSIRDTEAPTTTTQSPTATRHTAPPTEEPVAPTFAPSNPITAAPTIRDTPEPSNRVTAAPSNRITAAPTIRNTPAPVITPSPTAESLPVIRNILREISGDSLYDKSSPQFAALDWLVNRDNMAKDLNTIPVSVVQERYVIALLYTAMNGNKWADQYGFLSGNSVCDWNEASSAFGIFCDNDGRVNEIAMSKSIPLFLMYPSVHCT